MAVVYFCRHAEKAVLAGLSDKNVPLTEAGQVVAAAGGAWLRAQGAALALAAHTATVRTAETSSRILAAAGQAPPVDPRVTLPRALGALGPAFDALVARGGGDVLVVGHGVHQTRVERDLGGAAFAVPGANRGAIFRLERRWGGWVCTAAFAGGPKAGAGG